MKKTGKNPLHLREAEKLSDNGETEEASSIFQESEKTSREEIKRPIQKTPKEEAENLDLLPNKKKRVTFSIPTVQLEKLKKEAYEKNVTIASIIRESVSNHFLNLETVKSNPDNTETIQKIEACMKEATGFFGSFDLEEFLELAKANKLSGDIWTPELLETYLVPKLRQASEGLLSNDLAENTNATFEALQLDEKNKEFLAQKLGLELEKRGEVKEKSVIETLI